MFITLPYDFMGFGVDLSSRNAVFTCWKSNAVKVKQDLWKMHFSGNFESHGRAFPWAVHAARCMLVS